MSALRKAGVWLGLIEDEADDAAYDEAEFDGAARARQRRSRRYDDAYQPEEEPTPRVSRGDGNRPTERVNTTRRPTTPEPVGQGGATVRSITRDVRDTRDSTVSFPTRDNLALAPQPKPPQPKPPEPAAEEERRYHITTLHPTTYREARTIGEHFREGTPVIMNLTEMDEADARRLVDFGAGLAFGLRGTMERVTNRVFLLSPANVHVTAEDKAKIAEGEFFRPR
ncbi:MAG TPA: cell division protein SepF [Natronosporangium sp.]